MIHTHFAIYSQHISNIFAFEIMTYLQRFYNAKLQYCEWSGFLLGRLKQIQKIVEQDLGGL